MLKLIMKTVLRTRKLQKGISTSYLKKGFYTAEKPKKWLAEAITSENLNANWKKNLFFSLSVYKVNNAERVSV